MFLVPYVSADVGAFGFDGSVSAPRASSTQNLCTVANWSDFTMFWTGSAYSNDLQGPGRGIILNGTGALISMKARKCPGSYLDGVQGTGWSFSLYALKFPGSSNTFQYQLENSSSQDTLGTLSGAIPFISGMNTEQVSHSFTGSDGYTGTGTGQLVLAATGLGLQTDWAVHIKSGTGLGCVSVITNVIDTGSTTTITLSHTFETAPTSGGSSVLSFGPWEVVKYTLNAPLPTAEYQRARSKNTGAAGTRIILFAADCWVRGISDGWVWAHAGWGGHGYQPQMEQSAPGAIANVITMSGMTGLLMFNATQNTTTTQRNTFAGIAAAALGGVEKLVICCDQDHGRTIRRRRGE